MKKEKIAAISIIVLNFIVSAWAYGRMPDRVATHWGSNGEVNGYMDRGWGIFFLPVLAAALYFFLYYMPQLDPRKQNIIKFRKYYDQFLVILLAFLLAIHLYTIAWNLGHHFNINVVVSVAIAALFFAIGSLVGNAEPNYFIGIRTPWTLANDDVWQKTHTLGKKLFTTAAIISLLGIFFSTLTFWFIFVPIMLVSLSLVVYSYLEFRKITKK